MNDPKLLYMLEMLAVTTVVTYLLRALPFLFFGGRNSEPPAVIKYIGKVLAPAAIAMLVVYCFGCYARDCPAERVWGIAELMAGATTVILQLIFRNPLVSIIAGTAVYMISC